MYPFIGRPVRIKRDAGRHFGAYMYRGQEAVIHATPEEYRDIGLIGVTAKDGMPIPVYLEEIESVTKHPALKTYFTRAELDAFLEARGFKVDGGYHPNGPSNRFCDLYIGTGRPWGELKALAKELAEAMTKEASNVGRLVLDMNITSVTNPEHPDHGKYMLELKSFWDE